MTQLYAKQVKKKTWTYNYDKECDSLFVGEYPMPRTTRLYLLDEDINVYIDKNGNIRGIFIEYFETDLKKRLKKIAKVIFKADKNFLKQQKHD